MNILYVTVDDVRTNASHNIRNVSLINCLATSGHNIYLLFKPSNKKSDQSISKLLKKSIVWSNVDSLYNESSPLSSKKSFFRALKSKIANIISKVMPFDPTIFRVKSLIRHTNFPTEIDVIISSSDPNSSHILGKKIKKKYPKALWIQYWGDVMSEDIQFNRFKRHLASLAEKRVLRLADYIVYTNPLVANYMKLKNTHIENRIKWIATPYAINDKCITNNRVVSSKIGYFGSYSNKNRDISNICKAASLINIPMVVVGNGDLEEMPGIEIKKRCDASELAKEEAKCDIVAIVENKYISLSDGTKGCLQIPGKLYHYSNSCFNVLVVCEGNMLRDNYEQYDRFVFCKNDVEDIKKSLKDIEKGIYKARIHEVDEFSNAFISKTWDSLIGGR